MRKSFIGGVAFLAVAAALLAGGGQASAVTATCSSEYNTSNGTTTLPGRDIGTVQAGCEIGPFDPNGTGNLGNTVAVVNTSGANPSIYQFEWTGGTLTIEEDLGNNGSGHYIDVELAASGVTLNSDGSLSSYLVSTSFPYSSGGPPQGPLDILLSYNLPQGTYELDTFLGSCISQSGCSGGSPTDPNYAVLFDPPSATPLPAALPLFAGGLGLLGLFGGRKKRKSARTVAA
jgi:hypothetical protein